MDETKKYYFCMGKKPDEIISMFKSEIDDYLSTTSQKLILQTVCDYL
jgi:hypothetical protein